jgi:hypothetical protein
LDLEVDHVVAVKLWETLSGTPQLVGPSIEDEVSLGIDDISTTMNSLGNCCLLEKSFNIAKGKEPLRAFLDRVHEFTHTSMTVDQWAKDIGLDASLVDPRGLEVSEIRATVENRTSRMKQELKDYVIGKLQRADV